MMNPPYPLRFEPIYKDYLWGGNRLESIFGRDLQGCRIVAESWEICDYGIQQSRVENGPLAGMTLSQLVHNYGEQLLGSQVWRAKNAFGQDRFPLLVKFLDARENLSVQVHPNDQMAAELDPPDLGKAEAWVVIDAEPGSLIFAGLNAGVGREALVEAMESGRLEECLHRFEPKVGDCVFIPAGAVHVLGAGVMVAEIQQASDTTFRLFDWNRPGIDGKPRPLNVDMGLKAIDFGLGPIGPIARGANDFQIAEEASEDLVECDKFVLNRRTTSKPFGLGGDGKCRILTMLQGRAEVGDCTLPSGRTVLLPAALPEVQVSPDEGISMLEARFPD